MRGEGGENAWRCRDGNVGTQKRLRRHAVGATSGRSLKVKGRTFAYQEVKGVKEVKELRRMSCCLKTTTKRLLS